MPFIRYTRDKRGYETVFVVHGYRSQGQQDVRVLYMFRTPPHIHVGRQPLDEEAREALEHTHPDLRFDWQVLNGELASPSVEPPSPKAHRERRPEAPRPSEPPRPSPPVVVDDQTLLGRTLGAAEAGRLRSRYRELLQRILRRSRGPEEREQLLERAQRLNPDDWTDELAVRAGVSTVDAEWDAIGGELPQRRRGRRGGRRRDGLPQRVPGGGGSAIIEGQGAGNATADDGQIGEPSRDGDGGDGDPVGPDPSGPDEGHDFSDDD